MDHVSAMQGKIESLHHVCLELMGVISEYRAMPCQSLERRMFDTADRYKKRVADNAPDSTMYLSMTLNRPVNEVAAPVYVNSGRRLLLILRKVGAPEGKESSALRTFIWLRDSMSRKLKLMLESGTYGEELDRLVNLTPMIEMPTEGTEGQKVVAIAFANGAQAGRARFWLNSLLEEVEALNLKVNQHLACRQDGV